MTMPNANIVAIEFEVRDWTNGFYLKFEIPFTNDNYAAVVAMPGSANIKLLRAV
jgi:hypothetical protein